MNKNKRKYLIGKNIKVLAIKGRDHKEIEYDFAVMRTYRYDDWLVYAINEEGVFFFIDNCDFDDYNFCKITKVNHFL